MYINERLVHYKNVKLVLCHPQLHKKHPVAFSIFLANFMLKLGREDNQCSLAW